MKYVVPVLEGYNLENQPVFGQRDATAEEVAEYEARMPLETPGKPAGEFSGGGSYLPSGDSTKRTSDALIEFNKHKEFFNERGYFFGNRIPVQDMLDRQTIG